MLGGTWFNMEVFVAGKDSWRVLDIVTLVCVILGVPNAWQYLVFNGEGFYCWKDSWAM